MLREEAINTTPQDFINQSEDDNSSLSRVKDVWHLNYKSTTDEEDNDSDESDEIVKQYPKMANGNGQSTGSKKVSKKVDKPKDEVDVIMKLIEKDKSLVRRDLEARLARIRFQQANLKKYRKLSNITAEEITIFDETEDYSWWKGIEDDRGIYFAMGTKFSSKYLKGD